MNPVRRQSALLYANVSGDPATNVTTSQKGRSGDDAASLAKPNHMTLFPIGFHPLDETSNFLPAANPARPNIAPLSATKAGGSRVIEDEATWFGSQHSKDVGRFDRRVVVRETVMQERTAEVSHTPRLPPVLTPEEKARIAEEKRKEEEALLLASVIEKNIYKKHDETIQAMLAKLVVRMWQDGTDYLKSKIWTAPPKKK